MVMDFRGHAGLKTGVKNEIFWSEIGSGFGEPVGTPPARILGRTSQVLKNRYFLKTFHCLCILLGKVLINSETFLV